MGAFETKAVMQQSPSILLCNTQSAGELSGINTYLENLRGGIEQSGWRVTLVRTRGAGLFSLCQLIKEHDLIHINSGDAVTCLLAKCLGRPVLMKFHYPLWGEAHTSVCIPRGFVRMFIADIMWRFRQYNIFSRSGSRSLTEWGISMVGRLLCSFLSDAVAAPSEYTARTLGLFRDVVILKNPGPCEIAPSESKPDGCIRLFMASRLTVQKGADLAIEAVSIVKHRGFNVRLQIAGDGPALENLQLLRHNLALEDDVLFLGALSRDDILEYLRDCTVALAPSRWNEPAGYTWSEAATLNKAVIATRRGGIPEYVGDTGWLVDDQDAEGLADAISEIAKNPSRAIEMGLKAKERVSHLYSQKVLGRQFTRFVNLGLRRGWTSAVKNEENIAGSFFSINFKYTRLETRS